VRCHAIAAECISPSARPAWSLSYYWLGLAPTKAGGYELLSDTDLLEQPGHVLAEDLPDQEEMVDRVEGVDGTGPEIHRWATVAPDWMPSFPGY
jgi:hypothetical protein